MICIQIKQNICAFKNIFVIYFILGFYLIYFHFMLKFLLPCFWMEHLFQEYGLSIMYVEVIWLSDILVWGPEWIWLFGLLTEIIMIIRNLKISEDGLFTWLNCENWHFNISTLAFTQFMFLIIQTMKIVFTFCSCCKKIATYCQDSFAIV